MLYQSKYPVQQMYTIPEEGPEVAEEQSANPVPAAKSYRDLVFRRIISDLVPAEAISVLKFYITIALETVSTLPVPDSDQVLFFQELTSNTVLDSDSVRALKLDEIISSTVPDSEFYRALVLDVIASDPASTHGSTRDIVLKTLESNTAPAADYGVDLVLDSIAYNNYSKVYYAFCSKDGIDTTSNLFYNYSKVYRARTGINPLSNPFYFSPPGKAAEATDLFSKFFYVRALMEAAAELYDFLPKHKPTESKPAEVLPTSTSASSSSQTTTTTSTPEPQLVEAKPLQVTSTATATTTTSPSPSPSSPPTLSSPATVIEGDGTRSPKSPLSEASSGGSSPKTVLISPTSTPEPSVAPVSTILNPQAVSVLSSKTAFFGSNQPAQTQQQGSVSNSAELALQTLRCLRTSKK
ncbi:MAG: hypothetical protein WCW01_06075 [Gammaproteobacteria bacterium]